MYVHQPVKHGIIDIGYEGQVQNYLNTEIHCCPPPLAHKATALSTVWWQLSHDIPEQTQRQPLPGGLRYIVNNTFIISCQCQVCVVGCMASADTTLC